MLHTSSWPGFRCNPVVSISQKKNLDGWCYMHCSTHMLPWRKLNPFGRRYHGKSWKAVSIRHFAETSSSYWIILSFGMVETERTTHYLLVTHNLECNRLHASSLCIVPLHSNLYVPTVASGLRISIMIVYGYHRFIIYLIQHTLL